jgi:hypothetical protein
MEVVVAVGVAAVLVTATVPLLRAPGNARREAATESRLLNLKHAISGNPRVVTNQARTDFGFAGTMGRLPSSLDELWVSPGPAFSFDTSLRTGAGWMGPYLDTPTVDQLDDVLLDGWGNPIVYDPSAGTSALTGQTYVARLASYGADAASGGGDDLTVEIYERDVFSTVVGYVYDTAGNPLEGLRVRLHRPVGGVLSNEVDFTDVNGAYTFSNVPYGGRAVEIDPGLIYVDGSATIQGGQDDNVRFFMQNLSGEPVVVDSLSAEFSGGAFIERVRLDGNLLFDDDLDRAGSKEPINLSEPFEVAGTGSPTGKLIPVRIQYPFVLAPDFRAVASILEGDDVQVRLQDFRDLESGAAGAVDMSDTDFTVEFSDGSVAIFTAID